MSLWRKEESEGKDRKLNSRSHTAQTKKETSNMQK